MDSTPLYPSTNAFPTISKDRILSIFNQPRPSIGSFQSFLDTVPELFSKAPFEPENFSPVKEINVSDVFVDSAATPRPMRLVFQKKVTIPKSPFTNSGYADNPTHRIWYYLDERNNTQGPFTSLEMDSWFDNRFFFNELLIRIKENNEFVKLIHLFGKTEIMQVYKPVPFAMLDQFNLQQQNNQVPKSAEVKREGYLLSCQSASGKKESIYNFGFDSVKSLQGLSSPEQTPEKIKVMKKEVSEIGKGRDNDETQKPINPTETSNNESMETNQQREVELEEKVSTKVSEKKEEEVKAEKESEKLEEKVLDNNDKCGTQETSKINDQKDNSKAVSSGDAYNVNTKEEAHIETVKVSQNDNERGSYKEKDNSKRRDQYERDQYERVHEKDARRKQEIYVPKEKADSQSNKQKQGQKNSKGKKSTEADYTIEYVVKQQKKPDVSESNDEQRKDSYAKVQTNKKNNNNQEPRNPKTSKKNQETIIFVPKKKETSAINNEQQQIPEKKEKTAPLTQEIKEEPKQESKYQVKVFERKQSDTYEMLKETSEYYETSNSHQASAQPDETKPHVHVSSDLQPEPFFSFNPIPPRALRKPREKIRLIPTCTEDYEKEQERIVSTSLNLLDLEEKLTPSKKVPTKSTFNNTSLNPSPIIIDQRSVGHLYDFSDDIIYASFEQQGNSASRKL